MADLRKPTRQSLEAISGDKRTVRALEILFDTVLDLESRLAAAEATIVDHEARITALEP